MPLTNVGNELQEVDFGELIRSISQGIADGQRALDLSSIQTLQILASTHVEVIPEVSEVILPAPFPVQVSGHGSVMVTGARINASASEPVQMSALQAGLLPTFYQFTEASIQLKVSIQLREAQQTDASGQRGIFAFASHVNFKNQNTFSYAVDAASSVTVTMRPVPPNTRLQPSTITVNALSGKPVVAINP